MTYQAKYREGITLNGFSVFEGNLYKYEPCKAPRLIRRDYAKHFDEITTITKFKSSIRAGKYVWPGGYEVYFLYGDGRACCYDCAVAEYEQIVSDWVGGFGASFKIAGCDINWEDKHTYCEHCGHRIAPEYELDIFGDLDWDEDDDDLDEEAWGD